MKNMKILLALVISCAMLLGVLAGCGNNNEATIPSNSNYDVPEIFGTVMLNANGCAEISFDKDGKVLNIQEVDHDGHEMLADYTGYLQTPCVEVVKELVAISCNLELLNSEVNHIVIKQLPGSKLPGETFLADLAAAAEEAAQLSVSVSIVTEDDLDANGNIMAKKAYELLQNALHADKFDLVESNEELVDGVYAFDVVAGTLEGTYLVEAATGYVYEGSFETEYTEPEQTDYDEEEGSISIPSDPTEAHQEETLSGDTHTEENITDED